MSCVEVLVSPKKTLPYKTIFLAFRVWKSHRGELGNHTGANPCVISDLLSEHKNKDKSPEITQGDSSLEITQGTSKIHPCVISKGEGYTFPPARKKNIFFDVLKHTSKYFLMYAWVHQKIIKKPPTLKTVSTVSRVVCGSFG